MVRFSPGAMTSVRLAWKQPFLFKLRMSVSIPSPKWAHVCVGSFFIFDSYCLFHKYKYFIIVYSLFLVMKKSLKILLIILVSILVLIWLLFLCYKYIWPKYWCITVQRRCVMYDLDEVAPEDVEFYRGLNEKCATWRRRCGLDILFKNLFHI